MNTFSMHEAGLQLSELLELAVGGELVIISQDGEPKARLVPIAAPKIPRRFGTLQGQEWIADDFDAPLPPDIIADFEGR